jgi:hypothetical protein
MVLKMEFKLTTVGSTSAFTRMLLDDVERIHPMNRTILPKLRIMTVEIYDLLV